MFNRTHRSDRKNMLALLKLLLKWDKELPTLQSTSCEPKLSRGKAANRCSMTPNIQVQCEKDVMARNSAGLWAVEVYDIPWNGTKNRENDGTVWALEMIKLNFTKHWRNSYKFNGVSLRFYSCKFSGSIFVSICQWPERSDVPSVADGGPAEPWCPMKKPNRTGYLGPTLYPLVNEYNITTENDWFIVGLLIKHGDFP